MTDGSILTGSPNSSGLAGPSVTLVDGTTFAISSSSGDIESESAQGLFFDDTRFISCWKLRLNGESLENLGVIQDSPFDATFVARSKPLAGQSDSTLVIVRSRFVGNGMREDITIRNLDDEAAPCSLSFILEADFAHIFDVKDDRKVPLAEPLIAVEPHSMTFTYEHEDISRRLDVRLPVQTVVKSQQMAINLIVPPRSESSVCFEFHLEVNGEHADLRHPCGVPVERSMPAMRLREWEALAPVVHSGHEKFDATYLQSVRDLGSLRIFDPNDQSRVAVAAGAPWFMTLFGRDSLITAFMTMGVDRTLAIGTLLTLARLQGQQVDALTEEEPGKILHELRHGLPTTRSEKGDSVYYGSIDSTPLFVMALAELCRWGISEELLRQLLAHADRALQWIDAFGDRDGDGFVEYRRATARGLINQGWKDSFDGINFASGQLAEPPIALCEVQGYVYAAFIARANIARGLNDDLTGERYEQRAAHLQAAFNKQFWLADRGYFALGLDGDKRPIDSLTSNIGHCLWTGIVDEDKASSVAQHLLGPEMFTGWGIRTLSSSMGAYNPVSYHNGSVWPHDSAIAAAGLMRYGFVKEAQEITLGLFHAAEYFGGRLPELLCGFDRGDFSVPVRYPTSCSPQAWSSAAPLWLLRTTLLQLEPSIQNREIQISPIIPDEIGSISIENLSIGDARVAIQASANHAIVTGLPNNIKLIETD